MAHTTSAGMLPAVIVVGTLPLVENTRGSCAAAAAVSWLILQAATTAGDITSFITVHDVPLVGHYNPENMENRYAVKKRPLALFFYTVDWSFDYRDGG